MSYLLALLGFIALIVLHEAGHFAVAKAVGMRVERFSLFFGPLLFRVRRGETEYGIGPIPLGGYVKITGMNPHEDLPPEVRPRAYFNQPVWKRVVVILAGPVVNLLIAFFILGGVYLAQGVAKTNHGQIVYSTTVASGAFEPPGSYYLKPGDRIVAVDGRRGLTADQIRHEIATHKCPGAQVSGCQAATPVSLLLRRHGQLLHLSIRPRYHAREHRMLIGFAFEPAVQTLGPAGAASHSVSEMWYVTKTTVSTVARLFEPKERQQLHGVVGAFKVTQQRVAYSATQALLTLALISLSLGVVNLFPFLPLDGGHVFWALAEKVRRRRIPFSVMERAGAVGFVLIILVFVIGLSNDISTLTGRGFQVR
jgi:regulator of sigma E protease